MSATTTTERRFLRLREAAARLGVAECRVRELIRQGRLPAVKVASIPLIPIHAVEEEAARRRERRLRERALRHLTPRERAALRRRERLERALAEAEDRVRAAREAVDEATARLREAEAEAARLRGRLSRFHNAHQSR